MVWHQTSFSKHFIITDIQSVGRVRLVVLKVANVGLFGQWDDCGRFKDGGMKNWDSDAHLMVLYHETSATTFQCTSCSFLGSVQRSSSAFLCVQNHAYPSWCCQHLFKSSLKIQQLFISSPMRTTKYRKLIYFSHGCSPDQYTGLDYQYKSHLQKRIEQVVSSTVVMVSLLMMGMYAGIWKVACLFIILIKKYFHSCSLNKKNAILNTVPYII